MDRGSLPGNQVQPEEAELLPPLCFPERELAVLQGHGREHRGLRALHRVSAARGGSRCSLRPGEPGFPSRSAKCHKYSVPDPPCHGIRHRVLHFSVTLCATLWREPAQHEKHKYPVSDISSCRIMDLIQTPG